MERNVQTDGRTDGHNFYTNVARQYADARIKMLLSQTVSQSVRGGFRRGTRRLRPPPP